MISILYLNWKIENVYHSQFLSIKISKIKKHGFKNYFEMGLRNQYQKFI